MRIAINCRSFLTRQYTGIGRYAFNLVKSLGEIDQQNEYLLYAQKKYFDFKRHTPRVSARNFTVKVDWLGHGIARVLKPIDVYHSPSPDFVNISEAKIVATVHDLVYKTYPQGHTPQTCETTDKQLNMIVEKADKIICISQSTMKDLSRFFKVDPKKLTLVYQGVDKDVFFPLAEDQMAAARKLIQRRWTKKPFILFVGTIEPRKNLQNLLQAFAELKRKKKFAGKLIVVGMKGWMMEGLMQMVDKFKLRNEVVFPGYVSDDELRYLYNLTEVFIFPSFYEGFGFPIVEAFSCGATVVTSNVSSCPEIAAQGALIVDPYQPEKMGEAILRVLEDQALKKSLREKALLRAKDFSFENTARETLAVYESLRGA